MNGENGPGGTSGGARRRAGRGRTTALVAGAALCAVLLSACGVRTTAVPVDAGAAPSRLACEVDQKDAVSQSPSAATTVPVRVYLVCASALTAVERTVPVPRRPAAARVPLAQALLDALQAQPSAQEHQAGFTTYVEPPLLVRPGRPGDPAGALRLSTQPEDLPQSALAQIVCTFVENDTGSRTAGDDSGQVVLGGPGAYRPRDYTCDRRVKTDPDAPVPTAAPSAAPMAPATP
ncbi:hypothetical protein [Streptomyces sp. NBC_01497]|uniref:hypothetical protein n=1 Tax=Streptomyces sp. NBC_01497 TaxID=2903885 RepID=UPI002E35FFE7|nr:hypothetical protein [Streptomyces sp. NBC_01497]